VLHDIESWAETSDGPCVFWLNGLAGTGKSTIAATVFERMDKRQLLGASFFVNRQYADRRDTSEIVRTIANELVARNRHIA
jgi:pantothenate kinase-related protein Tda10